MVKIIVGYQSRSLGTVGQCELEIPTKGWKLNGKELPESSAEYIAHYGAKQSGQDAYASAAGLDEAKGMLEVRIGKWADGTMGVHVGGADPVMRFVREFIRERLGEKQKATYKAFSGDDAAKRRTEYLEGIFEKQSEDVQAKVREWAEGQWKLELDRRKKAAEMDVDAELEL